VDVESARHEWEEAHRRLEAEAAGGRRYEQLLEQVDAVTAELRRRVGQSFTIAELVDAYAGAERWSRDAVSEHAAAPGWPRTLSVVEGAAFYLYQRGAVDYQP
jgi:hypothetical protein